MKESRSLTESSHQYNSRALSQVKYHGLKPPQMKYQSLRLHVQDKLDSIIGIFKKNQKHLSNFFVKYMPFPQSEVNLRRVVDDRYQEIRLIKTVNKIYYGNFRNKQRHGEGVLIDEIGKIYQGNFVENFKSGHGVEIYPNKNIYIGEFSGNKKHGRGQFFWFNLSYPIIPRSRYVECYEGTWWGGLPDGRGTHQKASGDLYKGDFKNGLKHGKGEQDFENGDVYKGQYVNGLPEGYGIYIWSDGSRYDGQFKQGLRNGQGVWISEKEGEQYKGQYVLDKKCGYGEFFWSDKNYLYKGYFENDLRHGYGELFLRQQLEYKGNWISGKTELDLNASICSRSQRSQKSQKSQISKKSVSIRERSFVRTPKNSNFPSLSRTTNRPSSSLKNFLPMEILKEKRKVFTKRKKNNSQPDRVVKSFSKKKMTSVGSSQKQLKKRPLSYHSKPVRTDNIQEYAIVPHDYTHSICKKKNCGCHVQINLDKKTILKVRRRPITHLATQPMCF